MIIKNFDDLMDRVKSLPKKRVAIAAAADKQVLELAALMNSFAVADYLLVGDSAEIQALAKEANIDINFGTVICTCNMMPFI